MASTHTYSAGPSPEVKANIPNVFNGVAGTYDLLTALNPGYRKHLLWSAERLALADDAKILDLCCGTGLSTAALVKAYPRASIDAVDASEGMLEKAHKKSWPAHVTFTLGNAMALAESSITGPYDGILMAYGIRNMPDADACLRQLLSILKPGGVLCFHEYSVADSLKSQLIWRTVTNGIIIPGGLVTAKSTEIYRYLKESVLGFDGVHAFMRRLTDHGFTAVKALPMDGWQKGIVHSFLAKRPEAV
jgi:ubiquinone/menaquinone biosynthesis C-methylase UbiE